MSSLSKRNSGNDISPEVHIKITNVSKVFPARQKGESAVKALTDIDLSIRRGAIFGIIGRSGGGKSTLIRTINRLETPSEGDILIDGESILNLKGKALIALRRKMGMIFQHFNLHHNRTVYENVAFPLRLAGMPASEIKSRVIEALALTGIEEKSQRYPAQLSGGQKQRVGIARALVINPDILLCDEATSALDPESTAAILALLRDINQRLGITIVLITHEMGVIREICDRVAVIDHGRIVEENDVWRVFGAPSSPVTQTLLSTLSHALPIDIAERLIENHDVTFPSTALSIFRIYYDGEGSAPDIWQIAQRLNASCKLLDSDINRLQGHVQGSLLLGVDAEKAQSLNIVDVLSDIVNRVDVLGYIDQAS